jgi:outer membrane protein assembly factor BamB
MYQHDAARSGAATPCGPAITPANASTLVPRWFTRFDSAATASPAVVDGQVFVGESNGLFHALDAATGASRWTFDVTSNPVHSDRHAASYGEIVSSAAVGTDPVTHRSAVYVGGGGSVFALDAKTGTPLWATDTDPAHPESPTEVESSPVLYTTADGRHEVLVGNDDNESPGNAPTGLMALDAGTGALLWEFLPETRNVVHSLPVGSSGLGCGDIWGSPAVDARDGLVVFGTGNCPDGDAASRAGVQVPGEAIWAVSAETGRFRWVFSQLGTPADQTYGGDDDFGSTPNVVTVGRRSVVLAASKAGFVFALDAATGARRWATQAAQPGQTGPAAAGALGGFIGSGAVGPVGTSGSGWFGASAIPLPFKGVGPTSDAGPQVDDTLAADPGRVASLHALDVATGQLLWHQPLAAASFAPVSYVNGVVFAPATTSFSEGAYDAATGRPLWVAPSGGAPSSGVTVVGPDVFFGTGTLLGGGLPPQPCGVWSYGLA